LNLNEVTLDQRREGERKPMNKNVPSIYHLN